MPKRCSIHKSLVAMHRRIPELLVAAFAILGAVVLSVLLAVASYAVVFGFFNERELSISTAIAVFTSVLIAQFSSWAGAREIKDQTKALISRLEPYLEEMGENLYVEIRGKVLTAYAMNPLSTEKDTRAELSLEDTALGERGLSVAKIRLQKNSEDSRALELRTFALLLLERFEEALKASTKATQLKPKDAEAWNNRGIAMFDRYEDAIKDFDEAIELKKKAPRLKPDDAAIWFNRGDAKLRFYLYEDAIEDFDKAIDLKSNLSRAWFYRGSSKNNFGLREKAAGRDKEALDLHEDAIKDLDRAIRLQPDDAMFWVGRGIAYIPLERYDDALANYEEAIRLKPNYADAWLCCGSAKVELVRCGEAIKDFDKAILYKPDYALAWAGRAFAKLVLGDEKGARADAARAKELGYKPDNAAAWFARGLAKAEFGDEEGAEADFARARELGYKPPQ